jgi:dimethylglycine catabolism A
VWRPPQRIRFTASAGRVPSASEAAASRLFSGVDIGPVSLAQRTWVPAMVPWRATEDGYVTEEVIEWYERFARGEPGAIVVEATGIRDVPSGPLLRIGHDRFLPGLTRLADTVREASGGRTRLLIQLIDFLAIRRRPDPKKFFERFLAITDRHRSALPGMSDADIRVRLSGMSEDELADVLAADELEALEFGFRERVTDMQHAHIRDLPQVLPGLFADAAVRAEMAGFDGVELHYAHAYTMA